MSSKVTRCIMSFPRRPFQSHHTLSEGGSTPPLRQWHPLSRALCCFTQSQRALSPQKRDPRSAPNALFIVVKRSREWMRQIKEEDNVHRPRMNLAETDKDGVVESRTWNHGKMCCGLQLLFKGGFATIDERESVDGYLCVAQWTRFRWTRRRQEAAWKVSGELNVTQITRRRQCNIKILIECILSECSLLENELIKEKVFMMSEFEPQNPIFVQIFQMLLKILTICEMLKNFKVTR